VLKKSELGKHEIRDYGKKEEEEIFIGRIKKWGEGG
jgi:hypothetical protein